ncbi:TIGR03790 family protein [Telluria aromaticivorans]|uniref:TIGR03790 family protein n=1 Tax=Telluria aromaticivorans TaxID=2725995 RepID=A0A7Y2JZB4_9BURK|nr:TIGR03790 family protein [Telluria aromaticivorans]NNG23791.1 TIGR03790 family protein [Telluria aromaticivorans]
MRPSFRASCLSLVSTLACALGALHAPDAAAALKPAQLAIVINDDDPDSVAIGEYYRKRRDIPAANVVHVRIPGKPRSIGAAQFRLLKEEIDSKLGPGIQAVLMVWTAPYAVECNSITAAYTLGFDGSQCAKTCAAGQPSPYFNSKSARPYSEHGLRPSMLLPTSLQAAGSQAAPSRQGAKDLVDRGIAAGFRTVPATAYYLVTTDKARNSRAGFFPPPGRVAARRLAIKQLQADALEGVQDVLVYQTGMAQVAKLETIGFVPGALADHLTSLGGDLLGSSQMSSLRWLEAGATASYGTVSEPCNHWQKFPNPSVLLRRYLGGDSAIEAYWKSVAWPAQGLFIGEPLAAPYRGR